MPSRVRKFVAFAVLLFAPVVASASWSRAYGPTSGLAAVAGATRTSDGTYVVAAVIRGFAVLLRIGEDGSLIRAAETPFSSPRSLSGIRGGFALTGQKGDHSWIASVN